MSIEAAREIANGLAWLGAWIGIGLALAAALRSGSDE